LSDGVSCLALAQQTLDSWHLEEGVGQDVCGPVAAAGIMVLEARVLSGEALVLHTELLAARPEPAASLGSLLLIFASSTRATASCLLTPKEGCARISSGASAL